MGKKARLATRQRVAEMRERQQREERRRKVIIAVSVVAGVVVVAGVIALAVIFRPQNQGVQTFQNLSRDHTDKPVAYKQNPPAGGPHHPIWQNCGIYDKPVKNEHAVHSLEHGAVWITYRPDLPSGDVEKLRSLVRGTEYVLLSPYPDLPSAIALSAWGHQQKLDGVDNVKIKSFLRTYVKGRQTPEPGAPCSGGTGQPLS